MRLYVIRHGETEWNRLHLLQGRQGTDLDEEGVLLARITAQALKEIPFDLCYTSPLVRSEHTARILVEGRDIPVVEEPRIMEISFGVWEGKSCAPDHMEVPEEAFRKFREDPFAYMPPEGGESIRDILARTKEFYDELVSDASLEEKTILISTHGCAMRAFLHSVYEDPNDFWHGRVPMNCAVSIVDVAGGKGTLTESDLVFYGPEYYHDFYGTGYHRK